MDVKALLHTLTAFAYKTGRKMCCAKNAQLIMKKILLYFTNVLLYYRNKKQLTYGGT